jgi:deglycase
MSLSGRTIVVLAFPGYHELEFWYPVLRGREEDADVRIVASAPAGVDSHLGYPVVPDTTPEDLDVTGVHAVVVPGTVEGQPELSTAQEELLRAVAAAGGVVAAVGSGTKVVDAAIAAISVATTDELPDFFRKLEGALQ